LTIAAPPARQAASVHRLRLRSGMSHFIVVAPQKG
jgi:hypothetical protein